ncbi:MAG: hypothetical protein IPK74_27770 [Deltaproteobacteria bacterium]|nr:hypothetical protein [Deltaproteobacteria bacterium]
MSPPDPRSVLAHYRGAITPSTAQRDRLFAALDRAAPTAAATVVAAAAGRSRRLVLLVGTGLIATAVAAFALRSTAPTSPIDAAASDGPDMPELETPTPRHVDATARVQSNTDAPTAPALAAAATPTTRAAVATDPTPPARVPTRTRANASAASQRSRTDAIDPPRPSTPQPDPPPPPEPRPSDELGVDAEVALLRRATLALRDGRAQEAAALLDRHAREFPTGALVELREFSRARLRCDAIGDREATIDGFRARFPDSPHLARLQRECVP